MHYQCCIPRFADIFRSYVRFYAYAGGLLIFIVVIITLVTTCSSTAYAAQTAPALINYQGKLVDSTGTPLPTGQYNMRIRAYTTLTGGSPTYTETRDVTVSQDNRVQVTDGIFSLQIGSITGLSASSFASYPMYLEIELPSLATATCSTVGCESFTEGPMSPRQQIGASAYAMNADMIDGIDGSSLAQLSANQTFSGNNTFTGTALFKPASDSTTAFQIQNSTSSPLLVADTTSNFALKVGGGNVSPNGTPALLVLDYKNTSGDPSNGVNGAMYYNSAADKFRCMESGIWKDCISSEQTRLEVHYDFVTNNVPVNGGNTGDGALYYKLTNGAFGRVVGVANHPGIIQFTTSSSSTGLAAIGSSVDTTNGILLGTGTWVNTAVVRVPTGSSSTQRFTAYSGLFDNVTTLAPSNGCFFRYVDNNSIGDYWQGACRNGGTETTCSPKDSGGNAQTTTVSSGGSSMWYDLKVGVNAAATQATFALDNGTTAYTCTITTNIPTTNKVSIGLGVVKSVGTVSVGMDVDLTETIGEGLTR